ncbi:hypothetical protein C7475_102625 [Chitinophaga sp. S165]|nr:hypothetical protein C7475_102625 [Chitinophaga sp. S165]
MCALEIWPAIPDIGCKTILTGQSVYKACVSSLLPFNHANHHFLQNDINTPYIVTYELSLFTSYDIKKCACIKELPFDVRLLISDKG